MYFIFRAIIAVIIVFANTTAFSSSNMQHAIIVDAGSSGSRLHLFQYEMAGKLPVIEEIFSAEVKPGLSSYTNPNDAAASLDKLFNDALAQLSAKQISPNTVTVHVLATAGMRLLPTDKANEIYQAIRTSLKEHYTFTIGEVTTVPEKMEGIYGWLDVNYLANNFNATDSTVGIIDIGGASTEIAFATQDTSKTEDITNITVNGITYHVFSKNFLGLGQDQARFAMNNSIDADTCYPTGYEFTSAHNGRFNSTTCSNIYADIIKQHQVAEQVSINNQHFIAYSGAYYDYHFLDADNNPQQANVEQRLQAVCTQSWDQLKSNYTNVQEKYLANYCANSVYVTNLLFGAYHLQNGQLEVKSSINGKNIDWALGALLYALNY